MKSMHATRYRWVAILGVVVVSVAALLLPACTNEKITELEEQDETVREVAAEKPTYTVQPIEYYVNKLHQIPLNLAEFNQDFSDTDTVLEDNAWMSGLHYFSRAGRPELYALFSNNHFYQIEAQDLTLGWTADLESPPHPTLAGPVTSDTYIYWVTQGPRVVWYFRDRQPDGIQKRYESYLNFTPTSPPAANDAGIYMGASEHFRVYGYDERHEEEAWFWPQDAQGPGLVSMQPHADTDRCYFYCESGHIISIDTSNGNQNWIWPLDTEAFLDARFTVKDNLIYLGTERGKLVALDKSSRPIFDFMAQEPIVTTPFVEDRFIFFQTPRYLICLKSEYVSTGEGGRMLRLVNEDNLARGTDHPWEPQWRIRLVSPDLMEATDEEVMESGDRKNVRILMKGERWVYLLETKEIPGSTPSAPTTTRHILYRIEAETGNFDGELDESTGRRVPRAFDLSDFPYILENDDEDNRTIYFGTYEGYVFAMYE